MGLYDSDGNAVEGALPPDEAKALLEEKEKLKSLEEELTKLKEKDFNFSNLRSQKEEAEKKIESIKAEFEQKIEKTKKEVLEGVLKEHYDDALAGLADGDEELKKKIEQQYSRLSDNASTKAEIEKKLRDAWSLAQAPAASPAVGYAFSSAGSAPIKPASSSKKFSEEEKAFARMMASSGGMKLDDADFDRF